ncbi:MAG: pilus assembly protein CpaB [Woeseiaceae bacterium]|jgi:pilus assembly protein CpaB
MKRAQLLGIGIAGIAGIAAFVGMQSIVRQPPPKLIVKEQINSTQVLVAQTSIGLGSVANEANFRWQEWPKKAVNPSFITHELRPNAMRELRGSIARSSLLKDEPITEHKLISPGKGGVLAAILPAGMRAISTRITDQTAVGKMILPNDHVDVILTQRKRDKSGGEQHVSDTIFRNIRVLAIGTQLEAKEEQNSAQGNVATLELTSKQSEMLALANSMGEISLALRSIADLNSDKNSDDESKKKPEVSTSINIMRYGVKKRAYGVN